MLCKKADTQSKLSLYCSACIESCLVEMLTEETVCFAFSRIHNRWLTSCHTHLIPYISFMSKLLTLEAFISNASELT